MEVEKRSFKEKISTDYYIGRKQAMLLCGMYHHINSNNFSNSIDTFEKHLMYMKNKFNIVLPGDELRKVNMCLVFDDAYYDFYYFVFPLLKKYGVKAMLSIPVKYILDDTDLSSNKRLSVKHSDIMKENNYIKYTPFCTWKEITQMVNSNLVGISSHSFSHIDLTQKNVNYDLELKKSKEIIESKIKQPICSFTFPYGQFNERVKSNVAKYYKYLFGIGNIDNITWNGFKGVLYRIYCDDLKSFNDKLSFKYLLMYKIRRLKWQIIR